MDEHPPLVCVPLCSEIFTLHHLEEDTHFHDLPSLCRPPKPSTHWGQKLLLIFNDLLKHCTIHTTQWRWSILGKTTAEFWKRTTLAQPGCHHNTRGSPGDNAIRTVCPQPQAFSFPSSSHLPPEMMSGLVHICIRCFMGRRVPHHSWHTHILILNTPLI